MYICYTWDAKSTYLQVNGQDYAITQLRDNHNLTIQNYQNRTAHSVSSFLLELKKVLDE